MTSAGLLIDIMVNVLSILKLDLLFAWIILNLNLTL